MRKKIQLTYEKDSLLLFNRISLLNFSVFLDSAGKGRYDIFSANPRRIVSNKSGETSIFHCDTKKLEHGTRSPLDYLKEQIDEYDDPLPFVGGALGFISYDYAWQLESLPIKIKDDCSFPDCAFGLFDWAVVVDHEIGETTLVVDEQFIETDLFIEFNQALSTEQNNLGKFKLKNKFCAEMDKAYYEYALKKIHSHLKEGDIYQANFTQRFSTQFEGDLLAAYAHCRTQNPAPFSAFLKWNNFSILSTSPERFIQIKGDDVETKPIKGTMPRFSDPEQDRQSIEKLISSEKDRAENVMIVDLLRHDLSRTCIPGSVQVPKLCELQTFKNVHHLVSTIVAKKAKELKGIDVIKHAFPGGSITGAPKIRAMQIIESLELNRRGPYCGSIGYMSYHGRVDMNIVIRTLATEDKNIYAWAGGGIVFDSIIENEYQECLDKILILLRSLETFCDGERSETV